MIVPRKIHTMGSEGELSEIKNAKRDELYSGAKSGFGTKDDERKESQRNGGGQDSLPLGLK